MRRNTLLIVGLALLVVGIVGVLVIEAVGPGFGFVSVSSSGGATGGTTGATSSTSLAAAGQHIYQTGLDAQGVQIARSSIPISEGALMMGGGGCASCHGANGQGSVVSMMMGYIEAPDITYTTLTHEGYTDTTIYRAIRYGINEENKNLNPAMPRWQLTDTEVRQVVAYLKELSGQ